MSGACLHIDAPPQFDFRATVFSHGWVMLAPFSWQAETGVLSYTWRSAAGDLRQLRMSAVADGIAVTCTDLDQPNDALEAEISAGVRRMLSLDWDLGAFYAAMRRFPGYDWLEKERRGRILVGASLWEDLAKVLLTTNCNWAQTINMSRRLCQLGPQHPRLPGCHAFPSPQEIAALNVDELAASVRAGYRNASLHELAVKISAGEVNLGAWERLASDDLFRAVKSLRGFGDYAAGTITRLLGHFDKIAIDSACREMYANLHNNGDKGSDKAIAAHYAPYGEWRGLVMWMDIMRRHE